MKTKKILTPTLIALSLLSLPAKANDLLTGDVRLACEAILCLSSGEQPSECAKSLRRYFGISLKRMHETVKARKNFLNLCPSSKEAHMPELIDALANGAGRCDAAELNKIGFWAGSKDSGNRRFVVSGVKPDYCKAYENHGWTTVPKTKLEPVYCTRPVLERDGFGRVIKLGEEQYQCGQKWVDVK